MSDYETDNNNESINLLNDVPLSYVPETKPDTCKPSQSQRRMLDDIYSSDDDKNISHIERISRNMKTSSQRKNISQIKGYNHSSCHKKGNSSLARKKSRNDMSIPLPDELTKHSDIDECIESISSNMKDYFPSIDTKSDV